MKKRFNRVLSLILVLAMVCSIMPHTGMVVANATGEPNYLVNLDFEDGEVAGTVSNGFTVAEVTEIGGNKVLHLKNEDTTAYRNWCYNLGTSYTQTMTLSYNVAAVVTTTGSYKTGIYFPSLTKSNYFSEPVVRLGIYETNKLKWNNSSSANFGSGNANLEVTVDGNAVPVANLEWHTIKIVYTPGAGVGNAEVYVDGQLSSADNYKNYSPISQISIYFMKRVGELYVDNIRLTVGEDHTPAATPACMGEHAYTQQVVSDTHKATAASCSAPATYYYSCACGANGTETFASGEAAAHSYTGENGVCVNGCGKTEIQNQYVTYLDFEDGEIAGTVSDGFAVAEVTEIGGNKVLHLKNEDTTAYRSWYYSLGTDYTQEMTLSYNVAAFVTTTGSSKTGIYFPGLTKTGNLNEPVVKLGIYETNYLRWNNGTSTYFGAGEAAKNVTVNGENVAAANLQWHTVKIVYTPGEGVGTAQVYIDGQLSDVTNIKNWTPINTISIYFMKRVGELYVDNIRLTVGEDHTPAATPAGLSEHGLPTGELGQDCGFTLDFEDVPENYYPGTLIASDNYQNEDAPNYFLGVKEINGNKVLYMEGSAYGRTDAITWTYKLNGSYQKATLSYYVARVSRDPSLIAYPTLANQYYWNPVTKIGVSDDIGGELAWYQNLVGWTEMNDPATETMISYNIMEWQQIKIIYDATGSEATVQVYVDGVLTDAGLSLTASSSDVTQIAVRMCGNYYYDGKIYMDNFKVTVDDHEPMSAPESLLSDTKANSITADCNNINLSVGGHQYITPTVLPADVGNKKVTYTSSNPEVATVDEWGEVYGVGEGSATITVTSQSDATVTLQIPVTVIKSSLMRTIYVSAVGGGDGSSASNRCTLAQAMAIVSQLHGNMTGDIVISFAPGYYQQTQTLKFDVSHGGTNNYYVTYKAEGAVTIGGKQIITGWTEYNNGIYCAPAAGIATRQLYVNNVRAVRARSEGALVNAEFYLDSQGNVLGYTSDNVELAQYAHPEDLEFVYQYLWFNSRNAVDSVALNSCGDKVNITMSQPGFAWQRASVREKVSALAYYENALELLDEPGEWYLDTHAGVVYYMPRSWENMSTAEISVPVVEELISIEGNNYCDKVQNIVFDGITFADATWNYPTEMGVLAIDQNNHLEEYNVYSDKLIDGGVTLRKTNSVNFTDCTFTRLGSIGLKLVEGAQNSMIVGNKFFDISGSALAIGEPDYFNEDVCNPSDPQMMMKNCDVLNNYIHNIAVDYQSSAGLSVGFAANVDISYNEIFEVPYSAMHIGYGWKIRMDTILKNMRITNNYIHDTGWGDVADGGPIYLNGNTAGTKENPNVIADNYIVRSHQAVASIDHDGGSSGWYSTNNFCDELEHELDWIIVFHPDTDRLERLWAENNYITFNHDRVHEAPAEAEIDIEPGIVVDPNDLPAEVLSIIENAGLESAYKYLQDNYAEIIETNFGENLEIANIGDTFQTEVNGYDGLGDLTNATFAVYYAIEDPSVASVTEDGLITGLKSGVTTLHITVLSNEIVRKYSYNVYVVEKAPSDTYSLTIDFEDGEVGGTVQTSPITGYTGTLEELEEYIAQVETINGNKVLHLSKNDLNYHLRWWHELDTNFNYTKTLTLSYNIAMPITAATQKCYALFPSFTNSNNWTSAAVELGVRDSQSLHFYTANRQWEKVTGNNVSSFSVQNLQWITVEMVYTPAANPNAADAKVTVYINGIATNVEVSRPNYDHTNLIWLALPAAYKGDIYVDNICLTEGERTHTPATATCLTSCSYVNDVCTICGTEKHTHSYEPIVTASTCTEDGYTSYTCSCGDSYTEAVEATGHTWTDATCTTPKTCSVCSATEGEALGHAYTYTNNGDDHTVGCENCDYTATADHEFVEGECVCGAVETTEGA